MAKLSIDELVSKIKMLPPMDGVVQALLKITEDPDVPAVEVSKILSSDPALASKVLGLVNSPLYGFSNKISTVNQAVAVIGNKPIRNLVLSLSCVDMFKRYKGPVDLSSFWFTSISTAIAAQLLATRVRYPVAEDAFTAGLVLDVGQLVLSMFLPDTYRAVLDEGASYVLENESQMIGVNHSVVGALLLEYWQLPHHIVEIVENHHFDEGFLASDNQLLNIVHAAGLIGSINSNTPVDCFSSIYADQILLQLEIPVDEYDMLLQRVHKYTNDAAELFGITIDKANTISPNRGESVLVYGNDLFRTKWIASLLKNMGYYAVPSVLEDLDIIEAIAPKFAILDGKGADAKSVKSVRDALQSKDVKVGIITPEDNSSVIPGDTDTNIPELPLAFATVQLAKLLDELAV